MRRRRTELSSAESSSLASWARSECASLPRKYAQRFGRRKREFDRSRLRSSMHLSRHRVCLLCGFLPGHTLWIKIPFDDRNSWPRVFFCRNESSRVLKRSGGRASARVWSSGHCLCECDGAFFQEENFSRDFRRFETRAPRVILESSALRWYKARTAACTQFET